MADASPKLVNAKWSAGYSAALADGTVLNPGDTYKVPETEAKASDNWEPIGGRPSVKEDAE